MSNALADHGPERFGAGEIELDGVEHHAEITQPHTSSLFFTGDTLSKG